MDILVLVLVPDYAPLSTILQTIRQDGPDKDQGTW